MSENFSFLIFNLSERSERLIHNYKLCGFFILIHNGRVELNFELQNLDMCLLKFSKKF